MDKAKKQILTGRDILRDSIIFTISIYFVLLILNVALQGFVTTLFPLELWMRWTIGLVLLYTILYERHCFSRR